VTIFNEQGEGAFRAMEAALCRELAQQEGYVIATGGGTLVDPDNRARMMASGTVICLTATTDTVMARVGDSVDRPLLDGADPRERIETLLAGRRAAYAQIPWQLVTDDLTPEAVSEAILRLAATVTLSVRGPEGVYPIHIGAGILDNLGGALGATGSPMGSAVAVVTNTVVGPLYGAQVTASLMRSGFRPLLITLPDGEQHKTLATVADLYAQFLTGDLDRAGTVLALGGGVAGDIAGFAAATYMRGVRFAQVPTSLLAMTDASVGGKTGVDLPQGKNLVGAFKQPGLVLIDPEVLGTLPLPELRSGMAEVLKHGVIGDVALFEQLERGPGAWSHATIVEMLARSIEVKIRVVEQDPLEKGWRAALNLGHTVGHALEKLSAFTLRHGEAVSIGMVAVARIATALGRAEPGLVGRLESALTAWELPTRCQGFVPEAIWAAMGHDKKRRGRALRWVLPKTIGEVELVDDVPQDCVLAVLREMGAEG
jgi:3-dehydroquinate synthase